MDPNWTLKTTSKKRILVLEGDASVGEQSLALADRDNSDLTLQEVTQGFRMIEKLFRKHPEVTNDDSVIGVLLADCSRRHISGGGHSYTTREAMEFHADVDIIIDARMPLIQSIVNWAEEYYSLFNLCLVTCQTVREMSHLIHVMLNIFRH